MVSFLLAALLCAYSFSATASEGKTSPELEALINEKLATMKLALSVTCHLLSQQTRPAEAQNLDLDYEADKKIAREAVSLLDRKAYVGLTIKELPLVEYAQRSGLSENTQLYAVLKAASILATIDQSAEANGTQNQDHLDYRARAQCILDRYRDIG